VPVTPTSLVDISPKKGFKKVTGHRALFHKKKETMQAPTSRRVTPSSLVGISPKKGLFFKKTDRTQGSFSPKKREDAGTHQSSCDTNKSRRHQSKQRALHLTSGALSEKAPLKKGSFPQRDILTHAHAHVGRLTSGSLHLTSGPLSEKAPLKKGSFPQRDTHTHAHT